jgi:hypothetical protein
MKSTQTPNSTKSIILQLKSTQERLVLSHMHGIISKIRNQFGYKIRGHEVHLTQRNMERLTLKERVLNVSSFCLKNDIEYLTYHVPAPRNEAQSFSDAGSYEKASNLIFATINEAEMVREKCGLKSEAVIVYHLPSVISLGEIQYLNKELKFRILKDAENHLLDFYRRNSERIDGSYILTLENVFPKYYTYNYATINMFHPFEMIRLRNFGIKLTFDLSHYNIYANYLLHGKNNAVGDLDRQIYGPTAPSWNECIELFGNSLIQLHINDSKGIDYTGEGMNLAEGEIPIIDVLRKIKHDNRCAGTVRATIELRDGHLYHGKPQKRAIEWLLTNASDIFY